MIRFFQLASFIFALTIEVRVHASEIVTLREETSAIQEPQNCLENEDSCAVKTSNGKRLKIEVGGAEVMLGSATAAIRNSQNQLTLITGTLLTKSQEQLSISCEFGKVIVKSGEAIVIKEDKRVVARVINGEVYLQPRGLNEIFKLEPGQENFMGAVEQNGVAHTGIATAVVFNDHALLWSSLYSGKKSAFEKELKEFSKAWKESNQKAAATHSDLAKRRIASLEQEHQKRQSALKKQHEYESELRALYRRKALDQ